MNNTKGVVIAVLEMDVSSTGIWWYALTKCILEKIVEPCKVVVKSWICAIA